MSAFFPDLRFIFLTRCDKVAQGVSTSIALQTGKWTSLHPPSDRWANLHPQTDTLEKKTSPDNPVYDKTKILRSMFAAGKDELLWEMFFSLNEIEPYRLEYERLIEDPDTICREICDYVGVSTTYRFSLDNVPIKKQKRDLNEEWARRLKESMDY